LKVPLKNTAEALKTRKKLQERLSKLPKTHKKNFIYNSIVAYFK